MTSKGISIRKPSDDFPYRPIGTPGFVGPDWQKRRSKANLDKMLDDAIRKCEEDRLKAAQCKHRKTAHVWETPASSSTRYEAETVVCLDVCKQPLPGVV